MTIDVAVNDRTAKCPRLIQIKDLGGACATLGISGEPTEKLNRAQLRNRSRLVHPYGRRRRSGKYRLRASRDEVASGTLKCSRWMIEL